MTNDTENEPIIQTVAEPLQQYLQKKAAPQAAAKVIEAPGSASSPQAMAFRPWGQKIGTSISAGEIRSCESGWSSILGRD